MNSVLAAVELRQERLNHIHVAGQLLHELKRLMYRRYRDYRQRRRRTTQRRPRSLLKRPGVQIAILLIVALVIYLILQNAGGGGNSLPTETGVQAKAALAMTSMIGIY